MKHAIRAVLAAAICLCAASPAAAHTTTRHPGLDCKNVQTMTTQWLCDARTAKKTALKCRRGYIRRTVHMRLHGKHVSQSKCVRAPAKAATLAQTSPTAGAPTTPQAGATDLAPPSVIGVGNAPGCLSGADPTPSLRAHGATLLHEIIGPLPGEGSDGEALPCFQAAVTAGYKVSLAIQYSNDWSTAATVAFFKQVLTWYAPYAWAISIGNEQEFQQDSVSVQTGPQYAATWRAVEPVIASMAPQTIRVAGEVSPWALGWLEAAYNAGLPGVQAIAAHVYYDAGQDWNSPAQFVAFANAVGLPMWFTEGLDGGGAWSGALHTRPLSEMAGGTVASTWLG